MTDARPADAGSAGLRPRRGRPRDAEVDRRILAAARETVAAHGYAGLSIDAVAERAGVAKTTLYRRWPTKARLVADLVSRMQDEVTLTETGDVVADLTRLTAGIAGSLTAAGAPLVADLMAAMAHDPDFGDTMRGRWAQWRRAAVELLGRAVERGALSPGFDPEVVVDQLAGPLYYRLLFTGDPLTAEYAAHLVEAALRAHLRPKGPTSP
ncbi:DNA-binding transcriptional regulator, AcrR family [Actinopolymorpha cephalotaxi]|uniref:AcrR family transcriptional regulator n=1 Tax=Actinopolymorpha cephalotaxi TaxID=504797 RepID=A0A1I2N0Q8_9ACTN|nr:TetR/AcrR family transcriptional regulator [Actinopolymorpha cephalotaxi]NYH85745.1 AcrR family transcriptional regulator [Actinopolymorpha cephalotaxi]SFF97342.1 DNA-binding transcriptional regulator, AcrR family [Actinopolymorpha cephalotaxi]